MCMNKLTFVIIIGVALLGLYGLAQIDYFPSDQYVEITEIAVDGTTLAIAHDCKALVAQTSEERAVAIQDGLAGVIQDRPTIYDAFTEVLDAYNMSVVSMAIEGRDDKFYYSNIVLQSPDRVLKLDMKPSDGIALCLRTDAPMYIDKELIEAEGVDFCVE